MKAFPKTRCSKVIVRHGSCENIKPYKTKKRHCKYSNAQITV